jgi:hypothetical protein
MPDQDDVAEPTETAQATHTVVTPSVLNVGTPTYPVLHARLARFGPVAPAAAEAAVRPPGPDTIEGAEAADPTRRSDTR